MLGESPPLPLRMIITDSKDTLRLVATRHTPHPPAPAHTNTRARNVTFGPVPLATEHLQRVGERPPQAAHLHNKQNPRPVPCTPATESSAPSLHGGPSLAPVKEKPHPRATPGSCGGGGKFRRSPAPAADGLSAYSTREV